MLKLITTIILVAIMTVAGVAIYKGFTGEHDNAEKVANKASELVTSVADTFKDGAKDIAMEAKGKAVAVADSIKSSASATVDSVTTTVKSRIGDIRDASKEKFMKAKEAAIDGVDTVKKKISE